MKHFLIGLAIGDALGVPVEGFSRRKLASDPVISMRGYGTWNKPPGTWSDDTSMTTATMLSIIRHGVIDYSDIMHNFYLWCTKGMFTVDGLFDVGKTTYKAIYKYSKNTPALLCGGTDHNDNGNGSLMRMLPVALYLNARYKNNFPNEAMVVIHNVSKLTHAHPISLICCGMYCLVVAELAEGKPTEQAVKDGLDKGTKYYRQHKYYMQYLSFLNPLLKKDLKSLDSGAIKSSGYVLHSLKAALWCLLTTTNYKDLLLKAVNLGGDTDTIAAIAGGLGGLVYDIEELPTEWLETLRRREWLEMIESSF